MSDRALLYYVMRNIYALCTFLRSHTYLRHAILIILVSRENRFSSRFRLFFPADVWETDRDNFEKMTCIMYRAAFLPEKTDTDV